MFVVIHVDMLASSYLCFNHNVDDITGRIVQYKQYKMQSVSLWTSLKYNFETKENSTAHSHIILFHLIFFFHLQPSKQMKSQMRSSNS